jgi:hypothetical protein
MWFLVVALADMEMFVAKVDWMSTLCAQVVGILYPGITYGNEENTKEQIETILNLGLPTVKLTC